MHYRMIDALAEAHLMACTQKKGDIAQILLQAIEVEMEKYGRQRREDARMSICSKLPRPVRTNSPQCIRLSGYQVIWIIDRHAPLRGLPSGR